MKETLKIGKKYVAIKPAHSFGEIDGESVDFKETVSAFEVLPKPKEVTVFDGDSEFLEPLPEHLKKDNWYRVRSFKTGRDYWFNSANNKISEL